MSPNFTHQDIQELLGAFALDALDGDERDLVDAHLAGCPRCRAEVEGHRETAALLAHSGERAPDGVWNRIAEALDEAPPVLDLARITDRAVRRTIPLRLAAATMAVAAALALFLGVALGRSDDGRIGRLEREIQALMKPAVANAAYAALADPRAEQVRLASTDGKATAKLARLPDGTGYLVPDGLAELPAGRVYQLWAVRSDAKISLGVLGQRPEASAFRMTGPVVAYAITEEAAGGVATTQNHPVLVGYVKT
jgi:anti-sigma-K factor RskA